MFPPIYFPLRYFAERYFVTVTIVIPDPTPSVGGFIIADIGGVLAYDIGQPNE